MLLNKLIIVQLKSIWTVRIRVDWRRRNRRGAIHSTRSLSMRHDETRVPPLSLPADLKLKLLFAVPRANTYAGPCESCHSCRGRNKRTNGAVTACGYLFKSRLCYKHCVHLLRIVFEWEMEQSFTRWRDSLSSRHDGNSIVISDSDEDTIDSLREQVTINESNEDDDAGAREDIEDTKGWVRWKIAAAF